MSQSSTWASESALSSASSALQQIMTVSQHSRHAWNSSGCAPRALQWAAESMQGAAALVLASGRSPGRLDLH